MSKEVKLKKPFVPEDNKNDPNLSVIGSLLGDISWAGKTVNKYRNGGKGLENVLSAEVLQLLDFLPRKEFLGELIKRLHSDNSVVIEKLYSEINEATFNLFPGNHYLKSKPTSHQKGISVQPDGILETPSVYGLLELKRIKKSSFQPLQLAKEFYLVTRDAKERIPLLILIISKEPPVAVQSNGRVDIFDYIKKTLPDVYQVADSHHLTENQVKGLVNQHVAWITWPEIRSTVIHLKEKYDGSKSSINASIARICEALITAIDFHSS